MSTETSCNSLVGVLYRIMTTQMISFHILKKMHITYTEPFLIFKGNKEIDDSSDCKKDLYK